MMFLLFWGLKLETLVQMERHEVEKAENWSVNFDSGQRAEDLKQTSLVSIVINTGIVIYFLDNETPIKSSDTNQRQYIFPIHFST